MGYATVNDPDGLATTCTIDNPLLRLELLQTDTYQIAVAGALDREVRPLYRMTISCENADGQSHRETSVHFALQLKDVNDNAPFFEHASYTVSLSELSPIGTHVITVSALDADAGPNARIRYSVVPRPDGVDPGVGVVSRTGVIYLTRSLDYEQQKEVRFTVTATDSGTPSRTASAVVVMTILDVNDNAPVIVPANYQVQVLQSVPAGTLLMTCSATDADGSGDNSKIAYSLRGLSPPGAERFFSVSPESCQITVVRPLQMDPPQYRLLLVATDAGMPPLTGTANLTVSVKEVVPVG